MKEYVSLSDIVFIDLHVSLVGGDINTEGRVEILHEGEPSVMMCGMLMMRQLSAFILVMSGEVSFMVGLIMDNGMVQYG